MAGELSQTNGGQKWSGKDLIVAAHVVNQEAKRVRDLARGLFSRGDRDGARKLQRRMDELQGLKQRGLLHAYRLGVLRFKYVELGLSAWHGEGYDFYARFAPPRPNQSMPAASQRREQASGHIRRALNTPARPHDPSLPSPSRMEALLRSLPEIQPGDVGLVELPDPNRIRKKIARKKAARRKTQPEQTSDS